jgi:hypothetical protein
MNDNPSHAPVNNDDNLEPRYPDADPATLLEALHDAAQDYAARGWHVLRVKPGTKAPVGNAWQVHATTDPPVIAMWWGGPELYYLGVQLGGRSNLIDVECDSGPAEKNLALLLGEDYPVVPTFMGKRGKHRLFLWDRGFPCPDKAVFKFQGIEFRTGHSGGAQSLFPPSIHPDGPTYTWLVSPDDTAPLPFPAAALTRLRQGLEKEGKGAGSGKQRARVLADGETIPEGKRNDTMCSMAGAMRRWGFGYAAIKAALLEENRARCQPQLPEDKIDEIAAWVIRKTPAAQAPQTTQASGPRRTLVCTIRMTAQEIRDDG